MNPSQPLLFASPEDVEAAFYEAVARGDLGDLMAVWSEEEDAVCVHPTGQQFFGLAAIREGWRRVLKPDRMQMQARCLCKWQSMLMAVHQLVEHLRVDGEVTAPLLATHVYVRGSLGWRLACRHCSASAETEPMIETEGRVLH